MKKPHIVVTEAQQQVDSDDLVRFVHLRLKCMPSFLYVRVQGNEVGVGRASCNIARLEILAKAKAIRDELNTLEL